MQQGQEEESKGRGRLSSTGIDHDGWQASRARDAAAAAAAAAVGSDADDCAARVVARDCCDGGATCKLSVNNAIMAVTTNHKKRIYVYIYTYIHISYVCVYRTAFRRMHMHKHTITRSNNHIIT
jgi:hypothetical protein